MRLQIWKKILTVGAFLAVVTSAVGAVAKFDEHVLPFDLPSAEVL